MRAPFVGTRGRANTAVTFTNSASSSKSEASIHDVSYHPRGALDPVPVRGYDSQVFGFLRQTLWGRADAASSFHGGLAAGATVLQRPGVLAVGPNLPP